MNLSISRDYFGELLPYIDDENITDITWNGRDLWIDDLTKGRYREDIKLSDQFVSTFSTRLANLANKNFNRSQPLLEAETDDLRISVIDGSVTNTDRSIAIRKTPAIRRLSEEKMLRDGYAEEAVIHLLEALVRGHCSVIVTGDVGSGKTELIKYLTKFIPHHERAISIEDNYELRLSAINPELDCIEIKADSNFSYSLAIKAALRQLCKWLLMAEARSKEVVQLLEAASTGCIVMTTLHSDDVRKIPDRVVNMMGTDGEEKRNDVYNFFDIGIKIRVDKTEGKITRNISQICAFDHSEEGNSLTVIYDDVNADGFTGELLPENIRNKIREGNKENWDEVISQIGFLLEDRSGESDEEEEIVEALTGSENEMTDETTAVDDKPEEEPPSPKQKPFEYEMDYAELTGYENLSNAELMEVDTEDPEKRALLATEFKRRIARMKLMQKGV